MRNARQAVINAWGESGIQFLDFNVAQGWTKAAGRLARACPDYTRAASYIVHAVVNRLRNVRSGRSLYLEPGLKDLQDAISLTRNASPPQPIASDELRSMGLRLNAMDLVEPLGSVSLEITDGDIATENVSFEWAPNADIPTLPQAVMEELSDHDSSSISGDIPTNVPAEGGFHPVLGRDPANSPRPTNDRASQEVLTACTSSNATGGASTNMSDSQPRKRQHIDGHSVLGSTQGLIGDIESRIQKQAGAGATPGSATCDTPASRSKLLPNAKAQRNKQSTHEKAIHPNKAEVEAGSGVQNRNVAGTTFSSSTSGTLASGLKLRFKFHPEGRERPKLQNTPKKAVLQKNPEVEIGSKIHDQNVGQDPDSSPNNNHPTTTIVLEDILRRLGHEPLQKLQALQADGHLVLDNVFD